MGSSLSYSSATAVSSAAAETILEEASTIEPPWGWWCEPIVLLPSGGPSGPLVGATKLFLPGYTGADGEYHEVDGGEDFLMAFADAAFLVRQLCRWSFRHRIRWTLEFEGHNAGVIRWGIPSPRLVVGVLTFGVLAARESGRLPTRRAAMAIAGKYSDRKPTS